MFNEAWRYNFMDYILSHDWLFYLVIAYSALVLLKVYYVCQRIPRMVEYMREMKPKWNPALFVFMNIWLPIVVLVGGFIIVPFVLLTEKRAFFRPYPDEEMYEIALAITEKGDAL